MSERCPAVSPESGTPCALDDSPEAHDKGHESAEVDRLLVSWATNKSDHRRWAAVAAEPADTTR